MKKLGNEITNITIDHAVMAGLTFIGAPPLMLKVAKNLLKYVPKTSKQKVSDLCDQLEQEIKENSEESERAKELTGMIGTLLKENTDEINKEIVAIRTRVEVAIEGIGETQELIGEAHLASVKRQDAMAAKQDEMMREMESHRELMEGALKLFDNGAEKLKPKITHEGPGGSPAKPLENFTGRTEQMTALEDAFGSESRVNNGIVLVHGMPGSGRRTLVNQFVAENAEKAEPLFPKGVHWIQAKTRERDTRRAAKAMGWLEGSDIGPADYILRESEGHLIVLEGFSADDLMEGEKLPVVEGSTLAIAEESDFDEGLGVRATTKLEVKTWGADEARAHLKKVSKNAREHESNEDLNALCEFVDGYPPAVNSLAKWLDKYKKDPSDGRTRSQKLLAKLERKGLKALDSVAKGYNEGVANMLAASWEALENGDDEIDETIHPEDKLALTALQACYNEASFETLLVVSGFDELDEDDLGIHENGEEMLREALDRLVNRSLLHYDEESEKYSTLNMVRLFVEEQSAEEMAESGERKAMLQRHIDWVKEQLSDKTSDSFEDALVEASRVVDHAMELAEGDPVEANKFLKPIYTRLIDTGVHYATALKLVEDFLSRMDSGKKRRRSKATVENSALKANWLKEKGITQLYMDHTEGAIASLDEGIGAMNHVPEEQRDLETLIPLRVKRAEALLRDIEKRQKEGKEISKDDYKPCLEICDEVIALYEEKTDLDHIYLAEAYSKRAVILYKTSELFSATDGSNLRKEARKNGKSAFRTLKKHIRTLEKDGLDNSNARLEFAAMQAEDLTEITNGPDALKYAENALEICLEQVGEHHLRTARCYQKILYCNSLRGQLPPDTYQDTLAQINEAIKSAEVAYSDAPSRLVSFYLLVAKIANENKDEDTQLKYTLKIKAIDPGRETLDFKYADAGSRARGGLV